MSFTTDIYVFNILIHLFLVIFLSICLIIHLIIISILSYKFIYYFLPCVIRRPTFYRVMLKKGTKLIIFMVNTHVAY